MKVRDYLVRVTVYYHVPAVEKDCAIDEAKYLIRTESTHSCYPVQIDASCVHVGPEYDDGVKE